MSSNAISQGRSRSVFVAAILSGGLLASPAAEPPSPDVAPAADRVWSSERDAFAGPTLDPEWFEKRRVVVYLLPDGGDKAAVRRAAEAVIRDRWNSGDWSLKHVFVGDVPERMTFAARQKVAAHDVAVRFTGEAGQPAEYTADNEEFVRQHLYFVWDPSGEIWAELLGHSEGRRPAAVLLLDYGGRVVDTVDPTVPPADPLGPDPTAAAVRRLLPNRPELGG